MTGVEAAIEVDRLTAAIMHAIRAGAPGGKERLALLSAELLRRGEFFALTGRSTNGALLAALRSLLDDFASARTGQVLDVRP